MWTPAAITTLVTAVTALVGAVAALAGLFAHKRSGGHP